MFDIIIDTLDWSPITKDHPQYRESLSVCELHNSVSERCSCVKFSYNQVLTAGHCGTKRADIRFEKEFYKCKLQKLESWHDYAIYKCKGIESYPSAPISYDISTSEIYVMHFNCDWITDPFCDVKKLISYGEILSGDIHHTADTLPGSSGAGIFQEGHLIGIHTSGFEPGNYNIGTPMKYITTKTFNREKK